MLAELGEHKFLKLRLQKQIFERGYNFKNLCSPNSASMTSKNPGCKLIIQKYGSAEPNIASASLPLFFFFIVYMCIYGFVLFIQRKLMNEQKNILRIQVQCPLKIPPNFALHQPHSLLLIQ